MSSSLSAWLMSRIRALRLSHDFAHKALQPDDCEFSSRLS